MSERLRIGFVLHVMQVAGAEVLVAETIRRLGPHIEPVVFCLDSVGGLGEIMRAEGTEVLAFDRRPGFDLRVVWRLSRAIRQRRLQILHAHQYTPFFYGALGAKLAAIGTRVILTEHGRHFPDVVPRKRRLANRFFFEKLADRITAVCAFSAVGLSDNDGFRKARIEVIENGIDADRYVPASNQSQLKQQLGFDPARRYIITIARFHPVKDHRTLLRAFADVARQVADVDLLLAGDGPLRPELERLVAELGITNRVRFLGIRHDVPELLKAADVFVLPSVSEAASITLLEAMASGKAVVLTNVGGNPEIVRDGVEGLLTPRGDANAMASAMKRLLDDCGLATLLGRRAAERVRAEYQLDQTIERYRGVYEELARPRR